MARALRFAVLVAGLGLGVFSLAVARGGAGNSFGGGSAFAGAAELAAGYALLGVGVAALMRPRQARLGAILAAASVPGSCWSGTTRPPVPPSYSPSGWSCTRPPRRWSGTRCSHTQTAGLPGGQAG
jgi:hypothetical protein